MSDQSRAKTRYIGPIPMSYLSGIQDTSPDGRFTNGYNWADLLAHLLIHVNDGERIEAKASRDFDIATEKSWTKLSKKLDWPHMPDSEKPQYYTKSFTDDDIYTVKRKAGQFAKLFHENGNQVTAQAEIADAFISKNKALKPLLSKEYFLDDEHLISYKGKTFIKSYAEGGLTSQSFTRSFRRLFTWNIKHFFSRLILKSLETMRQLIASDDEMESHPEIHRRNSLVIEWSGANDLVTVSSRPTPKLAKETVKARIDNIRELIEKGYRHFVLFELPDLSMTPRYYGKKKKEKNFAYLTSKVFNDTLREEIAALKKEFPYCDLDVFGVNDTFNEIFENPEAFGFDKAKLMTPFLEHVDDPLQDDGRSPIEGYLFWDDVHPTSDLHKLLAVKFANFLETKYDINPQAVRDYHLHDKKPLLTNPRASYEETVQAPLKEAFIDDYSNALDKDSNAWFGSWRRSRAPYLKDATLTEIVKHGMFRPNSRSNKVLKELNYLDKENCLTEEFVSKSGVNTLST